MNPSQKWYHDNVKGVTGNHTGDEQYDDRLTAVRAKKLAQLIAAAEQGRPLFPERRPKDKE